MNKHIRLLSVLGAAILTAVGSARAQAPFELDSLSIAGFRWRNVGPANTMGRVSDVVGIPSPSKTLFAAAAAGGIWKSTNNGITWRPVFDREKVVSMGVLAIAPSDTMQVWAGTGEANVRNSVSPGGGVYKSTDGGLSWKLMGLEKTQTVGRIVVNPANPNVVFVAASGAPWAYNEDRGLYRTTDGGAIWKRVKFVSDRAGFIDVALDPSNTSVVWASSWERIRGPYYFNSGGPGSALWKSTDGGDTWTEVKGGGFPETVKGRISVAIAPSNPRVMYAMVEADTAANPKGDPSKPKAKSPSGLYRSDGAGATWTRTNDNNSRPFYYSQVRVHPKNPDRVYWSSTPVLVSNDGGKTQMNATEGIHVDHHGMWIDPGDPDRMIVGNDGGIGITFDQGGAYLYPGSFAISQLYNLSYDFQVPYRMCGGLQDNGSWCGPSRRRQGAITNAMWFSVGGGDGFVTQQDPGDPNTIYSESQGGAIARVDYATGETKFLSKPAWQQPYARYADSLLLLRGDTTRPLTADQKKRVAELQARQRADSVALDLRYNWNTPFLISPHNPRTLYIGANRVLKSTDRGDNFTLISPELTYADTMKIRVSQRTTGGITNDATGAETYGTIVSLNESPLRQGLLYAGTDDGRVWISRNDGGSWEELTDRFPGVPKGTYVSRIEPSPHDSATFFVTFDNHRNGDYKPYVFATTDFGRSFRSIVANLPADGVNFVHVIREDPVRRDLLFLGMDVGAFVSVNGGASWQRFMTGLPTVPVHDLRVHPRDHELMAATHGRGIWIVDVSALEQLDAKAAADEAHLFAPVTAYQYGDVPIEGQSPGHQLFEGQSPPYGAVITYRLARPGAARITITDATGDTLQVLNGPGLAGINRVAWNFSGKPAPRAALGVVQKRDSAQQMQRIEFVLDSLGKAGGNPVMLAMIRGLATTGDLTPLMQMFGGGGGGRGASFGAPPAWNPRPGESGGRGGAPGGGAPAGGAGGAGGAGAGAGGRGGAAAGGAPDQGAFMNLLSLFTVPGKPAQSGFAALNFLQTLGFGQLRFGGGAGSTAEPGTYLVTLSVGGKTYKQPLRVERATPGGVFR